MSLVVEAIKEYSQENENIFRQEVRKRLDRTWKRNAHVVIPYGYHLGFQAANGTEYIFSVDEDDNLAFGAAEDTPVSLASVSLVVAVSADVATLTAEVVAARDGEASLNARITTVHTAATSAGTAAATAQSEITAARDGESSLLAKVNSIDSAIVSEAGARASADTAITAAYQAADTSLQASITTNATAITNEASARASADTAITAAYQAADATLTASVSTNASAIATVDGKLSASYALTVSAGKIAQLKLLADGTTSTISFLATAFRIYDDSSVDVAPFEVTGGVVKIKTANIGNIVADTITTGTLNVDRITAGSIVTSKLGTNAVTQGVVDETDASQGFGGASWTDLADVSVTTPDADSLVFLPWSMYLESTTGANIAEARILRDASVIYQTDIAGTPPAFSETFVDEGLIEYAPNFNGQVSGFDTDAPGAAGTYVYTLQVRDAASGATDWAASKRRLLAILFKR